jgi:hypothetical protein
LIGQIDRISSGADYVVPQFGRRDAPLYPHRWAEENRSFLNVTWAGREGDEWNPQERMHLHAFDLKTVASLLFHGLNGALQRCIKRSVPIESEGRHPYGTGHEKECPARGGEFLFELLR